MAILKFPVLFIGTKKEQTITAVFDDCSKFSYIKSGIAHLLTHVQNLGRKRNIGEDVFDTRRIITEAATLDFFINDIHLSDGFFLVSDMKNEIIIGLPTIRKWRIKLNFEDDKVEVDPKVAKLQLI